MPLTPEQLAKIAQKDAALPAALKRNATTNYYEGYFFITLNTRNCSHPQLHNGTSGRSRRRS